MDQKKSTIKDGEMSKTATPEAPLEATIGAIQKTSLWRWAIQNGFALHFESAHVKMYLGSFCSIEGNSASFYDPTNIKVWHVPKDSVLRVIGIYKGKTSDSLATGPKNKERTIWGLVKYHPEFQFITIDNEETERFKDFKSSVRGKDLDGSTLHRAGKHIIYHDLPLVTPLLVAENYSIIAEEPTPTASVIAESASPKTPTPTVSRYNVCFFGENGNCTDVLDVKPGEDVAIPQGSFEVTVSTRHPIPVGPTLQAPAIKMLGAMRG